MKVEPRIRTATKNHAGAEPSPNCSLGFHADGRFLGAEVRPSFAHKTFCVVQSPLMPTHTKKIPTPTTTASQLNAQRSSVTSGRTAKIMPRPASVLAK